MPYKVLAWLLVPLIGLLELGGHFYFSKRAPGLEEFHAVRPAVEELRRGEELVIVAPDWAEPNARHAFGDALMPVEHVARPDESAFRRAIEVSLLGATATEVRDWEVLKESLVGKFRLRLLENPAPARIEFDFVNGIAGASVSDVGAGGSEPCPFNPRARRDAGGLHGHPAFPRERHVCPGGEFHFVGVTVVEDERWKPRRCIWAHPAAGKTLVIRYADVLLGRSVRGYATLPWWIEREMKGAPVQLEVRVDERVIGTFVHRDGDGWKGFEFPTSSAKKRSSVEFRVSSDRQKERQFCFAADTR